MSRVQSVKKLRGTGNSRVGFNVSPLCSLQATEIFQEYDIDGHHLWLWIVNELQLCSVDNAVSLEFPTSISRRLLSEL